MADLYPIATELSQRVLERRRREGELATPPLDQPYRDVQAVHRPIRGLRREMDDAKPAVVVGLTVTKDWRVPEDRRHE